MKPQEYLGRLRQRMNVVADRHDMQVLAEPDVAAKSLQEISDVFTALIDDWEQAVIHAGPDDGTVWAWCPVDGEPAPCSVLSGIASKYGLVGDD